MKIGTGLAQLDFNLLIGSACAAFLLGCGGSDTAATETAAPTVLKPMLFACEAETNKRYKVTILDSLGGSNSRANAINNHGQVVGYSTLASGWGGYATIWNGTAATNLGAAELPSTAYDINDAGQVVGMVFRNENNHPISWSGASTTDLETLGGGGVAYGINNSGRIVGTSEFTRNSYSYATLWRDGSISDLGTLGGPKRFAKSINDAGDIVGTTRIDADSGTEHAALWNNGSPVDLGGLGRFDSMANAINNLGQIVGTSTTAEGTGSHAVLWYRGTITDLNPPGAVNGSRANAINSSGQIVGVSVREDYIPRPTIWYGTTAVELSTLVDDSGAGVTLSEPADINDSGQIALQVTLPDGSARAAILTPIACHQ